jgi:hypothetical protein
MSAIELLTTSDCAKLIGMTGEFVRGEIREGRLKARVFNGPKRRRARYRVERAEWQSYLDKYWPKTQRP